MAIPVRKAIRTAGLLTVFAATFVVVLQFIGCVPGSPSSSSPPDPTQPVPVDVGRPTGTTSIARVDAPTEFSTVTDADVDEARSRLVSAGVTPAELAEACGHYADNGWTYAEAWEAARGAGRQRIAEVVTAVNSVAEEIALPGEWVRSVTGSLGGSPATWTEAERGAFDRAIVVRKSKLIEPLCAP